MESALFFHLYYVCTGGSTVRQMRPTTDVTPFSLAWGDGLGESALFPFVACVRLLYFVWLGAIVPRLSTLL